MLSIPPKNVFEAILKHGHDEDFNPTEEARRQALPTSAPAGSAEKVAVLRLRVEMGEPLWHIADRVDYSGVSSTTAPKRTNNDTRSHSKTRNTSNSTTVTHDKVDAETHFSNLTATGIDHELIKQYQAANELEAIKDREELGDLPDESPELADLFANVVAAQQTGLEENQGTALDNTPSQLNDDKFDQEVFSANLRIAENTPSKSEAEINLTNQSNSVIKLDDSNRENELVSADVSSDTRTSKNSNINTSSTKELKVGSSTYSRNSNRIPSKTPPYRSASFKSAEKPHASEKIKDHVRLEPATLFDQAKSPDDISYAAKMEALMAKLRAEGQLL
jgi:hypothetical protein